MKIKLFKDWKKPSGIILKKDQEVEVTNELGVELIKKGIASGPLVPNLDGGKKEAGPNKDAIEKQPAHKK